MTSRAIITYAADGHEELLDVSLPTYEEFARRHGYDVILGKKMTDLPPAWNKIFLLAEYITDYEEVVWFDSDLVVVNADADFPPLGDDKMHAMVRHFENYSEVPNSGVWRLCKSKKYCGLYATDLIVNILALEVFKNHGWWEQAALMTLMGYTVPPEGSRFPDTRCKNVVKTPWYNACMFMRLEWNSHPMYRADKPRIVHCSYPQMDVRLDVMRELVKNPGYNYPKYVVEKPKDEKEEQE